MYHPDDLILRAATRAARHIGWPAPYSREDGAQEIALLLLRWRRQGKPVPEVDGRALSAWARNAALTSLRHFGVASAAVGASRRIGELLAETEDERAIAERAGVSVGAVRSYLRARMGPLLIDPTREPGADDRDDLVARADWQIVQRAIAELPAPEAEAIRLSLSGVSFRRQAQLTGRSGARQQQLYTAGVRRLRARFGAPEVM